MSREILGRPRSTSSRPSLDDQPTPSPGGQWWALLASVGLAVVAGLGGGMLWICCDSVSQGSPEHVCLDKVPPQSVPWHAHTRTHTHARTQRTHMHTRTDTAHTQHAPYMQHMRLHAAHMHTQRTCRPDTHASSSHACTQLLRSPTPAGGCEWMPAVSGLGGYGCRGGVPKAGGT